MVTTDRTLGEKIISEVNEQLAKLETAATASESWNKYGEIAVVSSIDEAVDYANQRAPEHLEIQVENPEEIKDRLYNYGS